MKKWIVFCVALISPQILWAADIQATLEWSQRVELSTPISGTVQSVYVEVGDRVKKGQILLSLDDAFLQAKVEQTKSELTRLNAEAEEYRRELDRVLELHERTIVATTELDQAKLSALRSQSIVAEAKARLRQNQKVLNDAAIRAPFDAVVIFRKAETGQSVVTGLQSQMLLTLAKSGEMIARTQLASVQVDQLKTDQVVIVKIAEKNYTGKIKTLGLEPIKTGDELVYLVDVVFPCLETLRAGTPVMLQLP